VGVDTLGVSGEAAGKGDPPGRPYGVGFLATETQNQKARTQNPHLAGGDALPTMAGGAQARRLCHLYSRQSQNPEPRTLNPGSWRAGTPAPLVFP
jgi:hypothetical protein